MVGSPNWDNGDQINPGAATFGSGSRGVSGVVSASNSLIGSASGDIVGYFVTALTNGDYLVTIPGWENSEIPSFGATTWGDGTTGVTGPVTATNSLRMTGNVTVLDDGNYLVATPFWDGGPTPNGAVTFGVGGSGASGPVTSSNSAIGTPPGEIRDPIPDLTSNDAVVIPTLQDRVILMRLELGPRFADAPADIVVEAPPGQENALVTYNSPVGNDTNDGPRPSTCVPASGSLFPVGETTVTCSASDSLGLVGTTSFSVTVTGPEVVAITPVRLLDTRATGTTIDGNNQATGPIPADTEIELQITGRSNIPTAGINAATINITAINPTGRGYITVYPCGTRPNASTLNYPIANTIIANEIIAKLTPNGTTCIYTSTNTHLIADTTGYIPTTNDA